MTALCIDSPLPTREAPEAKSLSKDTTGAVMFLGIFMGTSLIGSMWALVGIGKSIVLREGAQQAADSAAFSSSVMQARGLNGIAAINLFMIALVALYLIIRLVAFVLQTIGKILMATVYLAALGKALMSAGDALENVGKAYLNGISPVLKGLSAVQTASAVTSGYLGQAAGIVNGLSSGLKGLQGGNKPTLAMTIGPSMVPGANALQGMSMGGSSGSNPMVGMASQIGGMMSGGGLTGGGIGSMMGGMGGMGGGGSGERLGLPVTQQKMKTLCDKAVDLLFQNAQAQAKKAPLIGQVLGWLIGAIGKAFSNGITAMFCNEESIWDENGPKSDYKPMKNGNDWQQTHAVVPSQLNDDTNHRVAMAAYKFGTGMVSPAKLFYTAQAESYFDCDGKWDDAQCNDRESSQNGIANSVANMKWRARLVRVRSSSIGGLGSFFQQNMLSSAFSGMMNDMLGKVPGMNEALGALDLDKNIASAAGNLGDGAKTGAQPQADVGKILFDSLFSGSGASDLSSTLAGQIAPNLFPGTNGAPGGVYH